MDLHDYLRTLRKHWLLVVTCVLLGTGAAGVVAYTASPSYASSVQLFVSTRESASDLSTTFQGAQFTQERVASYAQLAGSPVVTQGVIKDLGLPLSPVQLAGEVSASNPLNTVLINVTVTDRSPTRAQAIAASLSRHFAAAVEQLETPTTGGPSPVKVSVVKPATYSGTPVSPRKKLDLALGLLVGLAVGVGGAVLRETLDRSVKSNEQLAELARAPTVGVIGFDSQAPKRPLIVHSDPHSPRSEAFRQLRTNLQFIDVDETPRSIVITSSVPQEGKTTTACNLAISLAEAGLNVVLVEGDLRRPRVANYMGLDGSIGLTTVLVGHARMSEVLQPWGGVSMSVLASGQLPPNPSELLASRNMSALLRDLQNQFDLVVIDAPPLLPVTDAAVLANGASGAVLVVRAGKTRTEQVTRSVEALASVDARLLGTVLNMVPTKGPEAYRYGYEYSSYRYAVRGKASRQRIPVDQARRAVTVLPPGEGSELPSVNGASNRGQSVAANLREGT